MRTTKHAKVLELFRSNGANGVTQIEAIEYAGHTRLAAWVYAMSKRGYIFMRAFYGGADGQFIRYWIIGEPNQRTKSAVSNERHSAL